MITKMNNLKQKIQKLIFLIVNALLSITMSYSTCEYYLKEKIKKVLVECKQEAEAIETIIQLGNDNE